MVIFSSSEYYHRYNDYNDHQNWTNDNHFDQNRTDDNKELYCIPSICFKISLKHVTGVNDDDDDDLVSEEILEPPVCDRRLSHARPTHLCHQHHHCANHFCHRNIVILEKRPNKI